MSGKKFKALRKLINQKYKGPVLAKMIYRVAKKEMKLGEK